MSGFLTMLKNMASEIEALRMDEIEHHLILDSVVKDLRALAAGRTSELAGEWLQRKAEVNQPTGFVTSKPWNQIPVGWFVQAVAAGPWYEVLSTSMGASQQYVTIRMPDGAEMVSRRPPAQKVTCRAGSLSNPLGDAVQALGDGVEILEDKP